MILNAFIAAASVAAGFYALQILDAPVSQITAGAFGLVTCYVLTLPPALLRKTIVRLGGLSWTRNKTIVNAGPIELTATERESLPIPPLVGGVLLVAGVALMLKGKGK